MTKKRSSGAGQATRAGEFNEVLGLIEAARRRAYQAVNAELVGLCWQLGEYISRKIESAEWGDSVVAEWRLPSRANTPAFAATRDATSSGCASST